MRGLKAQSIWYYLGLAIGLFYIIYFFLYMNKDYSSLGSCSLVILAMSIIVLVIGRGYRFLSFPVIFSVLVWVFHFGFFPLYLFGAEKIILFNDLRYYSIQEVEKAFAMAVIFYAALVFGISHKSRIKLKTTASLEKIDYHFSRSFENNTWVIFFVCAVPYLYYAWKSITLGGYSAVRQNIMSGPLSYISLLLYACAVILFQCSLQRKNKPALVFLYAFFTVQIFSGQRFDAMCIELAFVLMHFGGKKLKIKTIVIALIAVLIGLYVLTMIGLYRLDFQSMFSELTSVENFYYYWTNNPIYTILADYGGTFASLLGSVRNYDASTFLLGTSYIVAIFHIFPFASHFFPAKYVTFINGFYASNTHSLGGSLFGEAYANFGVFGFIPCMILGVIISKLYTMERNESNQNMLLKCWFFIVYIQMFNLVRGYFKNVIFLSFWAYIVFMIISRKHGSYIQEVID